MKTIFDERNEAGETLSRDTHFAETLAQVIETAQNILNIPNTKTKRIVVFEDLRPVGSSIPNIHDPVWFLPRVDITKNEIIGQSWPSEG